MPTPAELLEQIITPPAVVQQATAVEKAQTASKETKKENEEEYASALSILTSTMLQAQQHAQEGERTADDATALQQASTDVKNKAVKMQTTHDLTNLNQLMAINQERMISAQNYVDEQKDDAAAIDATQTRLSAAYEAQVKFEEEKRTKPLVGLMAAILPKTYGNQINRIIQPLKAKLDMFKSDRVTDTKMFLNKENALVKQAELVEATNRQQMKENIEMNSLIQVSANNLEGKKAQWDILAKSAGLNKAAAEAAGAKLSALRSEQQFNATEVQQAIQIEQMNMQKKDMEHRQKLWEENQAAYESLNKTFMESVRGYGSLKEYQLALSSNLVTPQEANYVALVMGKGEAIGSEIFNTENPMSTFSTLLSQAPEKVTPEMSRFFLNIEGIKDNARASLVDQPGYDQLASKEKMAAQQARVKQLQQQAQRDVSWLANNGFIPLFSPAELVAEDNKAITEGQGSRLKISPVTRAEFATFATVKTDTNLHDYVSDMVGNMANSKLSSEQLSKGMAAIFDLQKEAFNKKGLFQLDGLRLNGKNLNSPAVWNELVAQHKTRLMYRIEQATAEASTVFSPSPSK